MEPTPLHWKHQVITTGTPGRSQTSLYIWLPLPTPQSHSLALPPLHPTWPMLIVLTWLHPLPPFQSPEVTLLPPTSEPFPPPAAPSPAPPHQVSASPSFKPQESLPRGLSSSQRRRRGFDPWVGKIPWKEKWQPTLQCSFLKNSHRGAWQITVHGVKKSDMTEHTCTTLGKFLGLGQGHISL